MKPGNFLRTVLQRGCLMLAAVLCAPASMASEAGSPEGQQRVEAFLKGLHSLQASFVQELVDRQGVLLEESAGTLAIRRPDRFRWDYSEPYEQVIVADGRRIWLYDADLDQVTVRRSDDTLSATPAMLLSGEGNLQDNFRVTGTEESGGLFWVNMEPRRDDTDFRWVRLGFAGTQLRAMRLADKLGQTTQLSFTQLERNPPLDPSRFTFTVPPGADIIGDASGSSAGN